MNPTNPCESCDRDCRYRSFIDCPIWCEWAAEQDRLAELDKELDKSTD